MKKLIALFVLLFAMAILPATSALAKESKDCCKKGEACEKPLAGKKAGAQNDAGASQKSCAACAKICEDTLKYFQKKGGKYTEAANLQKLKDCITLCNASADLQARDSAHAKKLLEVCHAVCLDCAKMCKDMNDPKLADCVKSCEECTSCCES